MVNLRFSSSLCACIIQDLRSDSVPRGGNIGFARSLFPILFWFANEKWILLWFSMPILNGRQSCGIVCLGSYYGYLASAVIFLTVPVPDNLPLKELHGFFPCILCFVLWVMSIGDFLSFPLQWERAERGECFPAIGGTVIKKVVQHSLTLVSRELGMWI